MWEICNKHTTVVGAASFAAAGGGKFMRLKFPTECATAPVKKN